MTLVSIAEQITIGTKTMNIYHRIFKLHQRKIPAQQIAATTHMPLKSVREIIKRLENRVVTTSANENDIEIDPYLDILIFRSNKYTLIDFSGFFIGKYRAEINQTLTDVRQQLGLTLAIKMDEVFSCDMDAFQILVAFHKDIKTVGKSLVLLSPSDEVEQFIALHHIESHLKVFGTERAFEEYAQRASHNQ